MFYGGKFFEEDIILTGKVGEENILICSDKIIFIKGKKFNNRTIMKISTPISVLVYGEFYFFIQTEKKLMIYFPEEGFSIHSYEAKNIGEIIYLAVGEYDEYYFSDKTNLLFYRDLEDYWIVKDKLYVSCDNGSKIYYTESKSKSLLIKDLDDFIF